VVIEATHLDEEHVALCLHRSARGDHARDLLQLIDQVVPARTVPQFLVCQLHLIQQVRNAIRVCERGANDRVVRLRKDRARLAAHDASDGDERAVALEGVISLVCCAGTFVREHALTGGEHDRGRLHASEEVVIRGD